MLCRFCGSELPENARFCNKCGKQFSEHPTPPQADIDVLLQALQGNAPTNAHAHPEPEKTAKRNNDAPPRSAPLQFVRKPEKVWFAIGLLLCLLIAGALAIWKVRHNVNTDDSFDVISGTEDSDDQAPEEQVPILAEWSKWVSSLPATVTEEDYDIETKTLCRSSALETMSSTDADSIEGWELCDTVDSISDYGDWSKWSTTKVKKSDSREVQTTKQYRYRDKKIASSSSSSMSGWTLDHAEPAVWSAWSAWIMEAVKSTPSREVEYKQVYRYQTKYAGAWGEWSSWSDTIVTESNSCRVQQQYRYRYRDLKKSPVYYFYRWSDWSNWSDTKVSESANRNVETRTLYRYRDKATETTYHFQRWGDWSDWGEKPLTASSKLRVERKVEYRYRPKN